MKGNEVIVSDCWVSINMIC